MQSLRAPADARSLPKDRNLPEWNICLQRVRGQEEIGNLGCQTSSTRGGQSATASDRTAKSNDKFAGITSREMLEELQARGYKWNSLWLEKVKIEKQFVKL